eukprot:5084626-Pyramimonas_sp.AAC.1
MARLIPHGDPTRPGAAAPAARHAMGAPATQTRQLTRAFIFWFERSLDFGVRGARDRAFLGARDGP